jgi:LytS/YehU family sensor histidine kinase
VLGIAHTVIAVGGAVLNAIAAPTERLVSSVRPGFIRLFGNPPLICGLLLSLKILKNLYFEQVKSQALEKEKINAELQLLKAQVHPHFLFNTLNNIYSFSLNQSPQAGALVQRLSGMLNYMIHDCEKPLVPLGKEIKLIRDYMGLEKVRYGNRLDLKVDIKGDVENKMIAPLLMIPFVENSFKHGASAMRGQQWIRLSVHINENKLVLELSNSKPPEAGGVSTKKGIGLANVKKRLQLLYPGEHFLETVSTNDSYIVHMEVNMQQLSATAHDYKRMPLPQPTEYE